MKGKSKKAGQAEAASILARKQHSVVVDFLCQEPFASQVLGMIPEGSKKVLLTKLLASRGPLMGKHIAMNTRWTAGAFWPAAQRLNEHLEKFSQGIDYLKINGIVIKIPIGPRGGHKLGYHLACFNLDTQAYLDVRTAADILRPVAQGVCGRGLRRLCGTAEPVRPEPDLKEEVLSYLENLAKECANLRHYFPEHLRDNRSEEAPFGNIRQTVCVIEDRRAFDTRRTKKLQSLHRESKGLAGLAYGLSRGMPEEDGESGGHGASIESIPWDGRAGQRFPRATIFGDPGSGKSWLLRSEAHWIASEAINCLMKNNGSLHEIDLPVLIYLPDLARKEEELEDAIITLVREGRSVSFCEYVRKQLASHHGVLLLDAWDEISDADKRAELKDQLRVFSHYPTRIILTSRIVGYELPQPPLPRSKELELIAWNWPQIKSYVHAWFGVEQRKGSHFLSRLCKHLQCRGLARIPLMLMLMCQTCPDGRFPVRRSDLYKKCLSGLLGNWPIQDKERMKRYTLAQRSATYVRELIEVLEQVGLTLHERGLQQFGEEDVGPVIELSLNDICSNRPSHDFTIEQITPTKFIERLIDDGVLISNSTKEGELRFLHLTFQEYLAARALAKRPDCIEIATEHIYERAWNQVLVMLGGLLDRPGPYIAALLRKNREDLLCRPFLLTTQVASEADRERLPKKIAMRLADEATKMCVDKTGLVSNEVVVHAARFLPEWATSLIGLVRNGGWAQSRIGVFLLGEIGSAEAVSTLVDVLRDERGIVDRDTVAALGKIGAEEAVPFLVQALRDERRRVRSNVTGALAPARHEEAARRLVLDFRNPDGFISEIAEALTQIGSNEAVSAVTELLQVETEKVREDVAWALVRNGSEQAVSALAEALQDETHTVRTEVAWPLHHARSEKAVSALIGVLQDEDGKVRGRVALALGLTGSEQAVSALIGALRNEDGTVNAMVALALGQTRSKQAVPVLIGVLQDEEGRVRGYVASALARIGSKEAISALIEVLRDEDGVVCTDVATVLGWTGSREAVPALIELLECDRDTAVRRRVLGALAHVGSKEAVTAIMEVLPDEADDVRAEVTSLLCASGSNEAITAFIELLKDENITVRRGAAIALGRIGKKEAVPYLLQILQDEDAEVRSDAVKALGRIGCKKAFSALIEVLQDEKENYMVRIAAACAVSKVGPKEAVPYLIHTLLQDKAWTIRQEAATALRHLGPKEAVPVGMEILRNGDDSAVAGIEHTIQSLAQSLDHLAQLCEEHGDTP